MAELEARWGSGKYAIDDNTYHRQVKPAIIQKFNAYGRRERERHRRRAQSPLQDVVAACTGGKELSNDAHWTAVQCTGSARDIPELELGGSRRGDTGADVRKCRP